MKHYFLWSSLIISWSCFCQNIDKSYLGFDFKSGEKTLFEDNFQNSSSSKITDSWTFIDGGGAASIIDFEGEKCLSFDAYYTRLKPSLFNARTLPDSFTIEYDTWLQDNYDGNPGVTIHLRNGDDTDVSITPNKHTLTVTLSNNETVGKDNPPAYFGEGLFYNRWVHISIAVYKKQLIVYLDQYKMLELEDIGIKTASVVVMGDATEHLKMLLKNFRIASGFPQNIKFDNGKFITRNIKFDVNKDILKPESIVTINQVKAYMDLNPSIHLEIDGHTDSDGTETDNLQLSQRRADAVKAQLINLSITSSRLTTKGFGENLPIDSRPTAEAKANNRRVEFIIIK